MMNFMKFLIKDYGGQLRRMQEAEALLCKILASKDIDLSPSEVFDFCKKSCWDVRQVTEYISLTGKLPEDKEHPFEVLQAAGAGASAKMYRSLIDFEKASVSLEKALKLQDLLAADPTAIEIEEHAFHPQDTDIEID